MFVTPIYCDSPCGLHRGCEGSGVDGLFQSLRKPRGPNTGPRKLNPYQRETADWSTTQDRVQSTTLRDTIVEHVHATKGCGY